VIWLRRVALALLGRYGARLRFPHLFLLAGLAFGFDLLLPDGLPFLDEIVLGVMTLVFASWKNKGDDVTLAGDGGAESGRDA